MQSPCPSLYMVYSTIRHVTMCVRLSLSRLVPVRARRVLLWGLSVCGCPAGAWGRPGLGLRLSRACPCQHALKGPGLAMRLQVDATGIAQHLPGVAVLAPQRGVGGVTIAACSAQFVGGGWLLHALAANSAHSLPGSPPQLAPASLHAFCIIHIKRLHQGYAPQHSLRNVNELYLAPCLLFTNSWAPRSSDGHFRMDTSK